MGLGGDGLTGKNENRELFYSTQFSLGEKKGAYWMRALLGATVFLGKPCSSAFGAAGTSSHCCLGFCQSLERSKFGTSSFFFCGGSADGATMKKHKGEMKRP